MGSRIKAVIFDLGKVLIDFDHRIAARRISAFCAMSAEEIYELFFDSRLTALFEEGKILPRDFFNQIKKLLDLKLDYDGFLPIWNEIFFLSPGNRSVYKIGKALRKNYAVALLSNVNILHFNYLKEKFPIFDIFHNITASCAVGFKKPDPRIYKKLLNDLKVTPQDSFYTDDRPELIQEANKLGMRSFIFENIDKLKKDLLSCGVSIDRESHVS